MKRLLRIFALACGIMMLFAVAACDKTVVYTVEVTCSDTIILNGVSVRLTDENGKTAGECKPKNGVATFELAKGTYTATITEAIEGLLESYAFTQATVSEKEPNAKIEIVPQAMGTDTVTYTITVLMPDGSPAANVGVQLCGGPNNVCNPGKTDENGVASFEIPAGEYEVHIPSEERPGGCTFNDKEYKTGTSGGALTVSFK